MGEGVGGNSGRRPSNRPSKRKRPVKGREGREQSRGTRDGAYLIYGRRPALEFLKSGLPHDGIEIVLVSDSVSDSALLDALPRENARRLARRDLDEMYPELNHQGIVLRFRPGRNPFDSRDDDWSGFLKRKPGLLLALDEIQDPQNLGSILRSAESLGAAGIFLTGRGSAISPAAVRVSAGAAFHVPAFTLANPNRLLDAAREAGYFIVSAAGDGADRNAPSSSGPLSLSARQRTRLPAAHEILLFIGNEGEGVRPLVRKKSDYLVSIPMLGKTASLNAGVAAGILIDRLIQAADEK